MYNSVREYVFAINVNICRLWTAWVCVTL